MLSFLFSQFSCFFELSVSLFENLLFPAIQFVGWSNVTDGTVQPDGVVVVDVLFYNSSGIVKGKYHTRAKAFILDRLVESLQFAVGLRVKR